MSGGSLQVQRNSILTSIYGRRIGLDKDEFIVGVKDVLKPYQSLTSGTTATAINNYGVTALDVTTAAASTASSVGTTEVGCSWTMDAPAVGVSKLIYKVSATGGSTMPVVVEFGSGVTAIVTTLGTTFTGAMLSGVGQFIQLTGVTTGKWLMTGGVLGTSLAIGATFASSN